MALQLKKKKICHTIVTHLLGFIPFVGAILGPTRTADAHGTSLSFSQSRTFLCKVITLR